jgi:hypothetical protein
MELTIFHVPSAKVQPVGMVLAIIPLMIVAMIPVVIAGTVPVVVTDDHFLGCSSTGYYRG